MSVGVGNTIRKANLVGGGEGIRERELVERSYFYFLVDEIVPEFFLLDFEALDMILSPVEEVSVFGFHRRIWLESLAISANNILSHIRILILSNYIC